MKKMKKLTLLLFLITFSLSSQIVRINGEMNLIKPDNSSDNISDDMKNLNNDKYASLNFDKAYVDDFKESVFLRFNIFDNQMEFMKSNELYYLQKNLGLKINFESLSKLYKVFNLSDELTYLRVLTEGKHAALLAKEIIKFTEAKPARTSYDSAKPAKFDRKDDEYYLSLDNKIAIEIPRNKNDFYDLFKDNSGKIRDFMKKNRLNHKDEDELKKIIDFYNTI